MAHSIFSADDGYKPLSRNSEIFMLRFKQTDTFTLVSDIWNSFASNGIACLRKNTSITVDQICPTRGPRAACSPVEVFLLPSLGFLGSKSILHTRNMSLFS